MQSLTPRRQVEPTQILRDRRVTLDLLWTLWRHDRSLTARERSCVAELISILDDRSTREAVS
jgi:hypothetical protein